MIPREKVFHQQDPKGLFPTTDKEITLKVAKAVHANREEWAERGALLIKLYQWGLVKIGCQKLQRGMTSIEFGEFAFELRERGWRCTPQEGERGLWSCDIPKRHKKRPRMVK